MRMTLVSGSLALAAGLLGTPDLLVTDLCSDIHSCSVVAVWGPTVPLAGDRAAAFLKRTTLISVPAPKLPSAVVGRPSSVSQFSSLRTAMSLEPILREGSGDDEF